MHLGVPNEAVDDAESPQIEKRGEKVEKGGGESGGNRRELKQEVRRFRQAPIDEDAVENSQHWRDGRRLFVSKTKVGTTFGGSGIAAAATAASSSAFVTSFILVDRKEVDAAEEGNHVTALWRRRRKNEEEEE